MLAALQDTEHTARVYADTVRVRRWFGEAVAEATEGRIRTGKGAN